LDRDRTQLGQQAKHAYLESRHQSLLTVDDVPEEFDDPWHHRALKFGYAESAYHEWINHNDDITAQKEWLEDRYGEYKLA
jgi:kinetochore protein NDC80